MAKQNDLSSLFEGRSDTGEACACAWALESGRNAAVAREHPVGLGMRRHAINSISIGVKANENL